MTAILGRRSLSVTLKQILSNNVRQCRSTIHTSSNHSKVYELRTYVIKPANFKDYLELTTEKIHLRMAHSKCNGFWMSEIGGLNEVTHLWEYDNFTHRSDVRQKLAKDTDWQNMYIKHMVHYLDKQENASLNESPLKQTEDAPLQEGGVYELSRYEVKPGSEQAVGKTILSRAKRMEELGHTKLMGMYSTDVGPNNSVYHLWNFKSIDKRMEAANETKDNVNDLADHVTSMSNKLMIPTLFSNLK